MRFRNLTPFRALLGLSEKKRKRQIEDGRNFRDLFSSVYIVDAIRYVGNLKVQNFVYNINVSYMLIAEAAGIKTGNE